MSISNANSYLYLRRRAKPIKAMYLRFGLQEIMFIFTYNNNISLDIFANNKVRAAGKPKSFALANGVIKGAFVLSKHIPPLIYNIPRFYRNILFEKFREMSVVIIEGGSAWLPALMWRLDRDWRGCRMEVPWVRRPPSEYIRDHIRLTTQPIEEPENPAHFLQTIEHMGSNRMLMFSTDYPHWDFDSPARALPPIIPKELRQRIMSENAIEFYNLS